MKYIISIAIGYLLGSANPAYICGRLKGFDIREKGTHNAGASNAKLVMGWPYFFICAIYDILKAVISYGVVNMLYHNTALSVLAGCSAVIGHCIPFYLEFKGGKGFASFIGLSLMLDPIARIVLLVTGLALAIPLKYIVIASAMQIIGFPVYMIISGKFTPDIYIPVIITSLFCVYKHKINIIRLLSKQEINTKGKYIGINLLNKK